MAATTSTPAAQTEQFPLVTANSAKKWRREFGEPTMIVSLPMLKVRAEGWLVTRMDKSNRPRTDLYLALDDKLTGELTKEDIFRRAVESLQKDDDERVGYMPSKDPAMIRAKYLELREALRAAQNNVGKFPREGDGVQLVIGEDRYYFRAEYSKFYPVFRKQMTDDEYAKYGSASAAQVISAPAVVITESF